jgi:hypothetical protein
MGLSHQCNAWQGCPPEIWSHLVACSSSCSYTQIDSSRFNFHYFVIDIINEDLIDIIKQRSAEFMSSSTKSSIHFLLLFFFFYFRSDSEFAASHACHIGLFSSPLCPNTLTKKTSMPLWLFWHSLADWISSCCKLLFIVCIICVWFDYGFWLLLSTEQLEHRVCHLAMICKKIHWTQTWNIYCSRFWRMSQLIWCCYINPLEVEMVNLAWNISSWAVATGALDSHWPAITSRPEHQ